MDKSNLETTRHGNGSTLVHLSDTIYSLFLPSHLPTSKSIAAEVLSNLNAQLHIKHFPHLIRWFSSWGFFSSEGRHHQCGRGEHGTPEASQPRRHTQEWGWGTIHDVQWNKTYLLLSKVGIQNHTSAIATNVEASLSEPHNLHHGDFCVVLKKM